MQVEVEIAACFCSPNGRCICSTIHITASLPSGWGCDSLSCNLAIPGMPKTASMQQASDKGNYFSIMFRYFYFLNLFSNSAAQF